jgi:uncharacterized membrane protein YphA (DoxX/SURF4 family)
MLMTLQNLLDKTRSLDFLGPLALRIYLSPIFIYAGLGKLSSIDDTAWYFGSLGLPAPELMAWLAGSTELIGGVLLIVGLAVRWVAIPLMFTMAVAAGTAHWDNGWHALPDDTLTVPWEWKKDKIKEANIRKERAREILKENSNYDWITEHGSVTILKNGIEFAATYFIMLLVLFFIGAGRYFSIDYWVAQYFKKASY